MIASTKLESSGPDVRRLLRRRHVLALFAIMSCGGLWYHLVTSRQPPLIKPSDNFLDSHLSRPALSEATAKDLTLNSATCAAEFPAFYPQLEETARYWRSKGGFKPPPTYNQTENSLTSQALIIDGQLKCSHSAQAGVERALAFCTDR